MILFAKLNYGDFFLLHIYFLGFRWNKKTKKHILVNYTSLQCIYVEFCLILQPVMSLCMAASSGGVFYLSPASDELRNLWLAPVAFSLFSFVYTIIVMRPEIKILLEKDVITKKGKINTPAGFFLMFSLIIYSFK